MSESELITSYHALCLTRGSAGDDSSCSQNMDVVSNNIFLFKSYSQTSSVENEMDLFDSLGSSVDLDEAAKKCVLSENLI